MTAVDKSPEGRRAHHRMEALNTARAHGRSLTRDDAGFWTWPGCPVETVFGRQVPTWNVGDQLIRDMIGVGVFEATAHDDDGRPTAVRVVGHL